MGTDKDETRALQGHPYLLAFNDHIIATLVKFNGVTYKTRCSYFSLPGSFQRETHRDITEVGKGS